MSSLDGTQKPSNLKSQNNTMTFLAMGMDIQNSFSVDPLPRIQSWSIIDDDDVFDETITSEIENRLDNIDSGKEKLKSYSNADDYLKHLDQILSED